MPDENQPKDSMKKEDPKEKYHSFKAFARASNVVYGFITTILLGILCGYFFDKWFGGDNWMLICILSFFGIGIINFYRNLLRLK